MFNQLFVIQRKKLVVLTDQSGSQLPGNRYQWNIYLVCFLSMLTHFYRASCSSRRHTNVA